MKPRELDAIRVASMILKGKKGIYITPNHNASLNAMEAVRKVINVLNESSTLSGEKGGANITCNKTQLRLYSRDTLGEVKFVSLNPVEIQGTTPSYVVVDEAIHIDDDLANLLAERLEAGSGPKR